MVRHDCTHGVTPSGSKSSSSHGDVQVVGALLVEQLGAQTKKEAMRKSALAIKTYYAQK